MSNPTGKPDFHIREDSEARFKLINELNMLAAEARDVEQIAKGMLRANIPVALRTQIETAACQAAAAKYTFASASLELALPLLETVLNAKTHFSAKIDGGRTIRSMRRAVARAAK